MFDRALPHIVDFRALASRQVRLAGYVDPGKMARLSAAISAFEGPAQVRAEFRRDERGRFLCELSVAMPVALPCQRCLAPMSWVLNADSVVAALWSETQCEDLPESLEPLITGEETDLWSVAEEELLLVLPVCPLHENADCGEVTGRVLPAQEAAEATGPERENPFAVLATLQRGEDTDK